MRLFIGGFQHVPLSEGWFEFLWNECDAARMSAKPFDEHRDYILMLMGV